MPMQSRPLYYKNISIRIDHGLGSPDKYLEVTGATLGIVDAYSIVFLC
jgi:hypothetical protein